jgi:hypothetical protein
MDLDMDLGMDLGKGRKGRKGRKGLGTAKRPSGTCAVPLDALHGLRLMLDTRSCCGS